MSGAPRRVAALALALILFGFPARLLGQGYSFQLLPGPKAVTTGLSDDGIAVLAQRGNTVSVWSADVGWTDSPYTTSFKGFVAFTYSAGITKGGAFGEFVTARMPGVPGSWFVNSIQFFRRPPGLSTAYDAFVSAGRAPFAALAVSTQNRLTGQFGSCYKMVYTDPPPTYTYTNLGSLSTKTDQSYASSMSADGNVIFGSSIDDSGAWRAFRWTPITGMVDIGAEYQPTGFGELYCSADGSVVFGVSPAVDSSGPHGYRWTLAGGRQDLGQFWPYRCTAEGNVAVGTDRQTGQDTVWIKGFGYTGLAAYLAQHGTAAAQGQTLTGASYVSADGAVIAGTDGASCFLATTPGFFVAAPDSFTMSGNSTLSVPAPGVLANDTNTSSGNATLVTSPANASAFSLNADGSFSYTPQPGYVGTDSFTYEITRNGFSSNVATATIRVVPPPKLATFTLSTGNAYMCSEFSGTATLASPTPSPIYVNVVSSDPSIVSVASNPYVPTGGTSTTIYFYSRQLSSFDYKRVAITASCGGVSIVRYVNVFPIPLKSFTVGTNTLHSGQSTTGTVAVNLAPQKLPIVVSISSSNNALAVPATVTIQPGHASASFTITAATVTQSIQVHLSAAVSGTVQSQTITVDP